MLSPQGFCDLSVLGLLHGLSEVDKGEIAWLIAAPLAGSALSVCRVELEHALAHTGIGGGGYGSLGFGLGLACAAPGQPRGAHIPFELILASLLQCSRLLLVPPSECCNG